MKNEQLLQLQESSKYFFWIDDQSGFNEEGLRYTSWYNYGSTLILREALSPLDEQSIPWLRLQMDKIIESLEEYVYE